MLQRRTPIKARSKPKAAQFKRFHGYVATLPCLACGAVPVEVHHVRHDGLKGIGKDHRLVVPLCPDCHRNGPHAVHRTSHPEFNDYWGVDQFAEAVLLWSKFDV